MASYNDFVDFGEEDDDFNVNFTDNDPNKEEKQNKVIPITYDYDESTTEKYRVLRSRKMDPISYVPLDEKFSFKFSYKWDPYTGERSTEKDPNGPLCFDPDILIKHFHTKRIDKLWVNPKDDNGGYYQGYYDDGVGAGEEFYVGGRGHHPEWYLFRLPIIDCYLTKSNNTQFITFGPKLTDAEVKEIQEIANRRPDNYKRQFGYNRPSIVEMKKLYDIAINPKPNWPDFTDYQTDEPKEIIYAKMNRKAVDILNQMRG